MTDKQRRVLLLLAEDSARYLFLNGRLSTRYNTFYISSRVFGPLCKKGLIAFRDVGFFITDAGRKALTGKPLETSGPQEPNASK